MLAYMSLYVILLIQHNLTLSKLNNTTPSFSYPPMFMFIIHNKLTSFFSIVLFFHNTFKKTSTPISIHNNIYIQFHMQQTTTYIYNSTTFNLNLSKYILKQNNPIHQPLISKSIKSFTEKRLPRQRLLRNQRSRSAS